MAQKQQKQPREQPLGGTVRLASKILNPQPPTKPLRSPLVVHFTPSQVDDPDLLYARVMIASMNNNGRFDERRESEMLTGELVCSPPTSSGGKTLVFAFGSGGGGGDDGPVFTNAAGGNKFKLKVEVGDYATDMVLGEVELAEIRVVKPGGRNGGKTKP